MSPTESVAPGRSLVRSATLDAVRGLAILQVLVWHLAVERSHVLASVRIFDMTWSGVDLFFTLSGFLVGGIILDNIRAKNFAQVFYARRAFRILPLYVIVVIGALLASGSTHDWWAYATMTQNVLWSAKDAWGPSWLGPTWSLAVEEQFYLLLPLVVWIFPRRHLPRVAVALIVAAPICRVICHFALHRAHAAYMLFPCRMGALFAGVLLAWAVREPGVVERIRAASRAHQLVLGSLWAGFACLIATGWDPLSAQMQVFGYSWVTATYAVTLAWVVVRPELDAAVSSHLRV